MAAKTTGLLGMATRVTLEDENRAGGRGNHNRLPGMDVYDTPEDVNRAGGRENHNCVGMLSPEEVRQRQSQNAQRWALPQAETPTDNDTEYRELVSEQPQLLDDGLGQGELLPEDAGARGGTSREGPTPTQRENHRLTRVPYEDWCYECVCGRGRDAGHHRRKAPAVGPPLTQMDYSFMLTGLADDNLATILTACRPGDARQRMPTYGFAKVVRATGRDPEALVGLQAWLSEAGLMGTVRLRTDGGPAIKALAQSSALRRAPTETLLETSPVGSSDSLGAYGRLAGLARTWRLATEKMLGITIRADDHIFSCMIRHAVFIYNRYQLHAFGETAYEHINGCCYTVQVYPFGTPVLLRRAGALEQGKLDDRRLLGLWIGRSHESEENMVATAEGIKFGRTVKKIYDLASFNLKELLQQIKWAAPGVELPETVAPAAAAGGVPARAGTGGACHPRGIELREFHAEVGPTAGCPACGPGGAMGRAHTTQCRALQKTWLEYRDVKCAQVDMGEAAAAARRTKVSPTKKFIRKKREEKNVAMDMGPVRKEEEKNVAMDPGPMNENETR